MANELNYERMFWQLVNHLKREYDRETKHVASGIWFDGVRHGYECAYCYASGMLDYNGYELPEITEDAEAIASAIAEIRAAQ